MSNVSTQVIQSMFNHLAASYSEDEAREILVQKYPQEQTNIYRMGKLVKSRSAKQVEAGEDFDDVDAEETEQEAPVKAEKLKVAKAPKAPKAEKPIKTKRVSKMSRARELYAAAEDKSRANIVEIFMKELDMDQGGATSYFYFAKRQVQA